MDVTEEEVVLERQELREQDDSGKVKKKTEKST
jgi:hypothetical protein